MIILTYCLFPNLRKLRYVELVFYVSISTLFAACGTILGPVPDHSGECWFQGFSTSIGYLAAVFWTTVILHQIFLVVVQRGKVFDSMIPIHLFCWGWPIILAILPLTTNTYSNYDDQAAWCFVSNGTDSPKWGELFWTIASFFFWIWLTILINIIQIVMVVRKLRNLQVSKAVRSTMRKLIWYPLLTMVGWFLVSIGAIHVISQNTTFEGASLPWKVLTIAGTLLEVSQGFFNACFFIGMNKIVREHWAEFLYRVYKLLFCCTFIEPAKDLRTKSTTSEFEGTIPTSYRDASMASEAELEMGSGGSHAQSTPRAHHPYKGNVFDLNTHDDRPSHQEDRDTFNSTNSMSFTDSVLRMSHYFSVSLPVEDESDYINPEPNIHAQSLISRMSSHISPYPRPSGAVLSSVIRPSSATYGASAEHTISTLHLQMSEKGTPGVQGVDISAFRSTQTSEVTEDRESASTIDSTAAPTNSQL